MTAGDDVEIERLVKHAYRTPVDVETAARHLWTLHQVAAAGPARGARRTLVSALAAVLLFATTGAAVALSGQSVPGDSLYTVKRGAERVHLLVSFAPESDARLHLRFARSRLAEAQLVAVDRPDAVPSLLTEIVESVDMAQAVGGSAVSEEVELVRHEASTALLTLAPTLDTPLVVHLDEAVRLLGDGALTASSEADPVAEVADSVAAEHPPFDPPGPGALEEIVPDRALAAPGTLPPALAGTGADQHGEPTGEEPSAEPVDEDAGEQPAASSEPPPASAAPRTPAVGSAPPSGGSRTPDDESLSTLERLESLLDT